MLTARRGLGIDEERLVSRSFMAAVRWATFAERLSSEFLEQRSIANTDPSEGLMKAGGPQLIAFRARRETARGVVAELEPILFPPDAEPSDG